NAVLHQRDLFFANYMFRFRSQRDVQGHYIGHWKEFIDGIDQSDFEIGGLDIRIVGDDLHAESQRYSGHSPSDGAEPDYSHSLAGDFISLQFFLLPLSILYAVNTPGDLANESKKQSKGQLGHRYGVGAGRVPHHDSLSLGRFGIYVVQTDAG